MSRWNDWHEPKRRSWNYRRPLTASEKIGRQVRRDVEGREAILRKQEWQRKQPSYMGPKERKK